MNSRFIYLVQHGDAIPKEINPKRPLSETGRETVKKVGVLISKHPLIIDAIWHSPKLRARETAEILAECLNIPNSLYECTELEPEVSPKKITKLLLKEPTQQIMIVGHLPHLSRLAGLILCDDENKEIIAFEKGCVVCVELSENGSGVLRWMLVPSLVV